MKPTFKCSDCGRAIAVPLDHELGCKSMSPCRCLEPGAVIEFMNGRAVHGAGCRARGDECPSCKVPPGSTHKVGCPTMEVMHGQKTDGGGLRHDAGKSRVDLIPADALMELGKVYSYGAGKYAPNNWLRGMPWSKVLGPLMRHLFKWMMGQRIDEESGQLHSAMFAWNAIALLTYELRSIGTDDVRPEAKEAK